MIGEWKRNRKIEKMTIESTTSIERKIAKTSDQAGNVERGICNESLEKSGLDRGKCSVKRLACSTRRDTRLF